MDRQPPGRRRHAADARRRLSRTDPAFSPDGNTIAFTGEYDGNTDVFTMPATGGVPKRITYHPDADRWWVGRPTASASCSAPTATASRATRSSSRYRRTADCPTFCRCRWPSAGAYSPDGKRMVYEPLDGGQFAARRTNLVAWKRYRGGEPAICGS